MKKLLISSLLLMGLSGITAQVLLLRELLIIFYGNELTIGVILANWLITEAIGAFFLGKIVENLKWKFEGFLLIQFLFSIFLPLAVYSTRIIKEVFGILSGEGLGLGPVFLFSFLIIFLPSVTHGALFTFGCKLFSKYAFSETESVGRVYVYETLGTILGGVFFSYLLLPYLNSLQIAFFISVLNLFFSLLILGKSWQANLLNKILGFIFLFFFFLEFFIFFGKGIEKIHWSSVKRQWKGYEIKHYQNSFFGNIVVGKKENTLFLFFNGLPVITIPHPDVFHIEEFSHFILLSHPFPKEILVISRGAGGMINEILKHPVEKIDYVELDPIFLKIIKKFPPSFIEKELNDPKVNIIYLDGRLFLKQTKRKYDLIIIGFTNPSDLQTNRYFTKEFFSLVKKRLKGGGILAFSLPSLPYALIHLKELKELNACILNTLKTEYRYTKIIPGDGNNLFLASENNQLNLINADLLLRRMDERRIMTSLLLPLYIEYRFQPFWVENFTSSLKGIPEKINYDFKPLATFFSLAYWNALFSPYLVWIFREIETRGFFLIILFFIFFVLLLYLKKIKLSVPYSVITTGFSGILFSLIIIFTFQIQYGYVFYWIGFLIASYMLGIALGSFFVNKSLEKIRRERLWFLNMELSTVLFSLFLIFMLNFSNKPFIFAILSLLSGLPIGTIFPLANMIYLKNFPSLGKTAGLVYSADLIGGWFGGILGGVISLPFLGIKGTCLLIAFIKMTSLLLFIFSKKL